MPVPHEPVRRIARVSWLGQILALATLEACGARTDISDERSDPLAPSHETSAGGQSREPAADQASNAAVPNATMGASAGAGGVPPSNAAGVISAPTAGTASAPPTTVAPTTGTTSPGNTTRDVVGPPPTATSVSSTNPATQPPVSGPTAPAMSGAPSGSIPPGSTCTTLAGASHEEPSFPRVQQIYTFGDSLTTACLHVTSTQVCLYGTAAEAGADYSNWGAGVGLQLVSGEDPAEVFDATSLGIAGVGFNLVSAESDLDVRLMATMANDPEIPVGSSNFEENPFIWGGSSAYDIRLDGEYYVALETLTLPEWTNLDPDESSTWMGDSIDLRRLHSLQFQIVTRQEYSAEYAFCVSNFDWRDENGATLPL